MYNKYTEPLGLGGRIAAFNFLHFDYLDVIDRQGVERQAMTDKREATLWFCQARMIARFIYTVLVLTGLAFIAVWGTYGL